MDIDLILTRIQGEEQHHQWPSHPQQLDCIDPTVAVPQIQIDKQSPELEGNAFCKIHLDLCEKKNLGCIPMLESTISYSALYQTFWLGPGVLQTVSSMSSPSSFLKAIHISLSSSKLSLECSIPISQQ